MEETSASGSRVIVASLFLPYTVSVSAQIIHTPTFDYKRSGLSLHVGDSTEDGFFLAPKPAHAPLNRRRRPSESRMPSDEPMFWEVEPSGHGNIGLQNAVESLVLNKSTREGSSDVAGMTARSKFGINRIWIGCLGGVSTDPWHESMKAEVSNALLDKHCVPVYITDEEADGHYNQFCKQVGIEFFKSHGSR
ncbi:hypothetical protein BC829DRAFT_190106 [Chytridium lagenaria]|nr:hypothetical protein BC829DRAFT_190106 [Chytridium lagenaria]